MILKGNKTLSGTKFLDSVFKLQIVCEESGLTVDLLLGCTLYLLVVCSDVVF